MSDNARDLLRPLLAQRLSPAALERLAAELDEIAGELRDLARARRADAARPAPRRVAGAGGERGGRPGAMHIYLLVRERPGTEPQIQIRIGRGVYDAYQATRRDPATPLRLRVEVVGRQLRLSEDPGGYLVTVNVGGIRLNASGSRDQLAALPENTRWPARAASGAIVAEL